MITQSQVVAVVGGTGMVHLHSGVGRSWGWLTMLVAGDEKCRGAAPMATEAIMPAGALQACTPAQLHWLPFLDGESLGPKQEKPHILSRNLNAQIAVEAHWCGA